jgi:S-formylglutathione hydrolase FrmB
VRRGLSATAVVAPLASAVALVLVFAFAPAPAAAGLAPIPARVVTWTTTSAYVNPNGPTPFNRPPGVAPRPNALRVNVYLPAGYDGRRRFPILWLLHGHGDAYDSWVNPQQGDLLQIAAGFPGIIVMPEAGQSWYTDWYNGGAHRPGWESYYLLELMPLVERRLKILPGRGNHAIAGLSMGGEGAAYFAEQRPGYFGAIATFSGALSIQRLEWPTGFNTQGEDYTTLYGTPGGFYAAGHNPTALAGNLAHTRVFVSVGDGQPGSLSEADNSFGILAETDLRLHALDFLNAVRAAGVDPTFTPHHGIHAWNYWRRDLVNAIHWGFFRSVVEAPSSWTYETVFQHARAWDLRLDFSAPPAALERFARAGATLSATGAGTVTVTTADGRRFTAALPFTRTLPPPRLKCATRRHRPPRSCAPRRARARHR